MPTIKKGAQITRRVRREMQTEACGLTATAMVVLLAAALPVGAQAPADSGWLTGEATRFIGSAGLGGGTLGLAGQGSVGTVTSSGEFLVRGAAMTDFDLQASVPNHSWDIALLYGRRSTAGSRIWLRAAAGPAFVRTVRRGATTVVQTRWMYSRTTEQIIENAFGLAVQLDAVWQTDGPGFGLGAFGNLNGDRSFVGAMLSVHFGFEAGR